MRDVLFVCRLAKEVANVLAIELHGRNLILLDGTVPLLLLHNVALLSQLLMNVHSLQECAVCLSVAAPTYPATTSALSTTR